MYNTLINPAGSTSSVISTKLDTICHYHHQHHHNNIINNNILSASFTFTSSVISAKLDPYLAP